MKKPIAYVKTGKKMTAIVGYPKKDLPRIVKKVVKSDLRKGSK